MSGGTYGLWMQQSTKFVDKEEVKSNSVGACGRNQRGNSQLKRLSRNSRILRHFGWDGRNRVKTQNLHGKRFGSRKLSYSVHIHAPAFHGFTASVPKTSGFC